MLPGAKEKSAPWCICTGKGLERDETPSWAFQTLQGPKMLNWVSPTAQRVCEPLLETLPQWLTTMCHIPQVWGQKKVMRLYENHFVKQFCPLPYCFSSDGFLMAWHPSVPPLPWPPFLEPPAQTAGPVFAVRLQSDDCLEFGLYPSRISSPWWWPVPSQPHFRPPAPPVRPTNETGLWAVSLESVTKPLLDYKPLEGRGHVASPYSSHHLAQYCANTRYSKTWWTTSPWLIPQFCFNLPSFIFSSSLLINNLQNKSQKVKWDALGFVAKAVLPLLPQLPCPACRWMSWPMKPLMLVPPFSAPRQAHGEVDSPGYS